MSFDNLALRVLLFTQIDISKCENDVILTLDGGFVTHRKYYSEKRLNWDSIMTARLYFAWKMMKEAAEADRREEERRDKAQRRNLCQVNRVSDKKFLQLYRLTKTAFIYLCQVLRENSDLKGSQRVSLETKAQEQRNVPTYLLNVLSALLFYANGEYQRMVGEARHLGQQTVSKYVHEVTEALNHPNVFRKYIKFPDTLEARQQLKQNFYNLHGFPGVLGCIDGSHFRIVKPRKDEEHMYYCRKHYHSLNVQLVSDHQGRILAINPKFGGANHDAFVWENSSINSFMQSLHQNGESVWLLGDSGYPQRPWLMTPYSNPTPNSAEETYNRVHGRTRVIIENTFGRLKNRWRCVCKDRALHYKPAKCAKIITACSVLHNIALDFRVPLEDVAVDEESNVPTLSSYAEDDRSMLHLGRQLRDRVALRLHTVTTI